MRKLMIVAVLLALLVPLFQTSAQDSNGAGLALVVAPAPIYVYEQDQNQYVANGGAILFCSAVPVSRAADGYAELVDQGGWIPTTSFIYIDPLTSVAGRFALCAANAHG
jgi:hypothetical protein